MKAEGMVIVEHINNMAFLGFIEVIKHLPFIRRVKKNLLEVVNNEKIKIAGSANDRWLSFRTKWRAELDEL